VPQLAGFIEIQDNLEVSRLAIQLSKAYPAFVTGCIASSLALWLLFRCFVSASLRDRLKQRTPLVGPVLRWTAWSHFCDIMALLLDHGTPLVDALGLAGAGVGSHDVRESAGEIAKDVAAGVSLRASPYARTRVPPSLYELMAGAEAQGTLPQALRAAARAAAGRARLQSGLVLLVAPWLGFAVIAVLVTLCAVAVFLPMIRLLEMLS
jgi:type II secretory pathway component PulF